MYKYIIVAIVAISLGQVVCQQKGHDHSNHKMDDKMIQSKDHEQSKHKMDSSKTEAMDHDKMGAMHKEESMKVMHDNPKTIYYTCPMESHKHVHSSEPGKCPECGMTLVASEITSAEEAEYYGCPMPTHSHVRSENPGNCNECGMELKPMRLKKS